MLALFSFLAVAIVSVVIQRIATVALALTGLSRDSARFQSLSALTGTGFTTTEAEHVMSVPVRRKIVQLLMMARSLGIIGAVSTLVVSFAGTSSSAQGLKQIAWLVGGLVMIAVLGTSPWVDAHLSAVIRGALQRWSDIEIRDYSELLGLQLGYGVLEVDVDPDSWLANHKLNELELPDEGVTVLGIQRVDGSFIGAPQGASRVRPNDKLILYGRTDHLSTLSDRPSGQFGDQEREAAVQFQRNLLSEQNSRDDARNLATRQVG